VGEKEALTSIDGIVGNISFPSLVFFALGPVSLVYVDMILYAETMTKTE